MAEYTEVIKQFKRMCKLISSGKCARGECPMGCENIGQCRKIAFEQPSRFKDTVMTWAANHPEPVYPTWEEWLQKQGVLYVEYIPAASSTTSTSKSYVQTVKTLTPFYRPIPADIAEKLGLQPKEK